MLMDKSMEGTSQSSVVLSLIDRFGFRRRPGNLEQIAQLKAPLTVYVVL